MSYPQGPGQWLPPPTDYYGYGQPPPPKPSSIPMVIGILAIIFAGLGLLVTGISMLYTDSIISSRDVEALGDAGKRIKDFHMIEQTTYLLIGILHLVAGIMCVGRRRAAPTVAIVYAVIKIVSVVTIVVLTYTWLSPVMDKYPMVKAQMTTSLIFGGIFNLAWPIVVLALMSRPSARAACDR